MAGETADRALPLYSATYRPLTRKKGASRVGFAHSEQVRERIRAGWIVSRLHACVAGRIEMSAVQVRAAEVLLRKCLPDLHVAEINHNHVHHDARELSDALLQAIAGRAIALDNTLDVTPDQAQGLEEAQLELAHEPEPDEVQ